MERSRQLQGVAAFVVQAEVQAPDLGGGIHTQAHQGIRQLQQDTADQVNEAPGVLGVKQWIDAIINDKEPCVKPEEAFKVTQILEAIYKASETNSTIKFE